MRLLMTIHHELDANLGAPGATLSLGHALEQCGVSVDYFSFDEAFGACGSYTRVHSVTFPVKLAAMLAKSAKNYDAIDGSTGDLWPWLSLGRPGARASLAAVTRAHGLEHQQDINFRQARRAQKRSLPISYRLYTGGYRLWEVDRSISLADHLVVLNTIDYDYAIKRFHFEPDRVSVIPNGISETIHRTRISESDRSGPISAVAIGSWIERKGITTLISACELAAGNGSLGRLRLVGTSVSSETILAAFPERLRPSIEVFPTFKNESLPELTRDFDVLLHLSRSEGFSLALVEGMACGLIPIATPVGGVSAVVADGQNGFVVPIDGAEAVSGRLRALAQDPVLRSTLRSAAKATSSRYTWRAAAERSLKVYERIVRTNAHKP